MRVIGDLTTNHTGDTHEWFRRAQADPAAPERGFYYFDETLPHGYDVVVGDPAAAEAEPLVGRAARRRAGRGRRRKWLRPPYDLDGWRIDVANMTGRYRGDDLSHEVARGDPGRRCSTVEPDALLVAEHAHDFRDDLAATAGTGTMNYAGFLRPVWSWLHGDLPDELEASFWGFPVGLPTVDGRQAIGDHARVPRPASRGPRRCTPGRSLDSHDSARFRDRRRLARRASSSAIGLQMTMPGVPMVFAGDEIGLEGEWGEDARRTMPVGAAGDVGRRPCSRATAS